MSYGAHEHGEMIRVFDRVSRRSASDHFRFSTNQLSSGMAPRRFPKPWTVEPMPNGYRVIDANGVMLAHVYGQPDGSHYRLAKLKWD
jgi:hypothetical protein